MKNRLRETKRVAAAVEQLGIEHDLPIKTVFRVTMALGEAVANVINHGYRDDAGHEIQLTIELQDHAIICEIEDDGVPFNPLDAPLPDIAEHARQRKSGGLGILFIRTFMDEVAYERTGGKNRLKLVKNVSD